MNFLSPQTERKRAALRLTMPESLFEQFRYMADRQLYSSLSKLVSKLENAAGTFRRKQVRLPSVSNGINLPLCNPRRHAVVVHAK